MIKVLFCAYDAGGGNAIFPVAKKLARDNNFEILCLVGGPSKNIFDREGVEYTDADILDIKLLEEMVVKFHSDLLLSGTSAGLTFDKILLPIVKEIGAKTIYIVDYWAHYRERFSSDGQDLKYLPDMVCVMDERAKTEMIAEGFKPEGITVTGNPYFDVFRKNIKKDAEDRFLVLFVSQPYADRKEEFGYNEFDVLDDLLRVLGNLSNDFRVIIRPHPREDHKKFDGYLIRGNVSVDSQSDIEKLISSAGLVVGMNSMVLFQSAVAGKKVVSYQPNLKTRDFAVSNDMGLSLLAKSREDLAEVLRGYLNGDFPMPKHADGIIVANATENIINIIKQAKI